MHFNKFPYNPHKNLPHTGYYPELNFEEYKVGTTIVFELSTIQRLRARDGYYREIANKQTHVVEESEITNLNCKTNIIVDMYQKFTTYLAMSATVGMYDDFDVAVYQEGEDRRIEAIYVNSNI